MEEQPDGTKTLVELKPNGANITLADCNKKEYIRLMLRHIVLDSVSIQLRHLLKGVYEVSGLQV
jgi:hypothetical protein